MFNILTIIGTRPQIIKSNILSCEFKKYKNLNETILDTGQHYDYEMSKIFYEEFGIIKPDINLNVGSNTEVIQITQMIEKIDNIIKELSPHFIIVYGDIEDYMGHLSDEPHKFITSWGEVVDVEDLSWI